MKTVPTRPARLTAETLESRELLTVASAALVGSTLVVAADDAPTRAEVRPAGGNVEVRDLAAGTTWTFPAAKVAAVWFKGGAGADRFSAALTGLPVRADGAGGNDALLGGTGKDLLTGGPGSDTLTGGPGADRLNGGAGDDQLLGGAGDDTLVAVDDGTADLADGGAGRDVLWVDKTGAATDQTPGVAAGDAVEAVDRFVAGDRTLDGDRLADPAGARSARTVAANPLFAGDWGPGGRAPTAGFSGPTAADIKQGSLGDCWLMAGLGAIAQDSPTTLRQRVVDFDDGTYGVKLGTKVYRVDNDLPGYAGLGRDGSMWVAVTEKAFATYRSERYGLTPSYAYLTGGWGREVNQAFGNAWGGFRMFSRSDDAPALADLIAEKVEAKEAVTIGILRAAAGSPLLNSHMYTVMSVQRDGRGKVVSLTLRNPWGRDGKATNDGNAKDGLVTVTPDQIAASSGAVNWGKV